MILHTLAKSGNVIVGAQDRACLVRIPVVLPHSLKTKLPACNLPSFADCSTVKTFRYSARKSILRFVTASFERLPSQDRQWEHSIVGKIRIELDDHELENQALASITEIHKESLTAMQLVELRISFLTKKFGPLDILSWWLFRTSRLSNAKLNVTRLHELGYAIREEALSLQYTVGYEGTMEDGEQS
jgi:hypothetical protein